MPRRNRNVRTKNLSRAAQRETGQRTKKRTATPRATSRDDSAR